MREFRVLLDDDSTISIHELPDGPLWAGSASTFYCSPIEEWLMDIFEDVGVVAVVEVATHPGRYARGRSPSSVPGSPRKSFPRRSAIADSAIPVVLSVPETIALTSPERLRISIAGRSSSASMPRISRGTPGSIATQRPRSSSSQIPGAEPYRLVRMLAPAGISACVRLEAGNPLVGNQG